MLLVCVGPDSYRAVQRARSLELAYREKFDPKGESILTISSGKTAVDEVLKAASSVSLFQPRRFLRVDGLLSLCPKQKREVLASALLRDPERIILVSVEEKPFDKETEKWLKTLKEVRIDAYPLQTGRVFQQWLSDQAKKMGYTDQQEIAKLSQVYDGDAWSAISELEKSAAGGTEIPQKEVVGSLFDQADTLLFGRSGEKRTISLKYGSALLSVLQHQLRSQLRILGQETSGIHPFVVRKLSKGNVQTSARALGRAMIASLLQRSGLTQDDEIGVLLQDDN